MPKDFDVFRYLLVATCDSTCMHARSNGAHWVLYVVYVPVGILYQSLGVECGPLCKPVIWN